MCLTFVICALHNFHIIEMTPHNLPRKILLFKMTKNGSKVSKPSHIQERLSQNARCCERTEWWSRQCAHPGIIVVYDDG